MTATPTPEEQIRAILGGSTFRWAHAHLPDSTSIDDVRFRDLVSVTEEDVYDYVQRHGFPERVVAEGKAARSADNQHCIEPLGDGRWSVHYSERGKKSSEVILPTMAAARREVVHRLMTSARISLNHRYRLAHPEEDLPLPSEMD